MNFKTGIFRIQLQLFGCLLACLVAFPAQAQLYAGIQLGPSVQTITENEATLTQGFKPLWKPNAGLQIQYRVQKKYSLRLGFGYSPKGAKILQADLGDTVQTNLHADYIYVSAGVGYIASLGPTTSFELGADFVFGNPVREQFSWKLANGNVVRGPKVNDFFAAPYLGLNLYLNFPLKLADKASLYFQPTLELGLNQAYATQFFKPKFVGFSPLMGFVFPIFKAQP